MNEKSNVTSAANSFAARESWEKIFLLLSRELSDQSRKAWFEPIQCLALTDTEIVLGVPNEYFGGWIRDKYQAILQNGVKEVLGGPREISFAVVAEEKPVPDARVPESPRVEPSAAQGPTTVQEAALNRRYTFDDFVVGPGNRFAHAASVAVSEAPAKNYNPLFIHGPVGLGKTHLMQSIAHEMKRRYPHFRVLYISSEKFTNQLITAIQTRSTQQFRAKYRTLDLLLIDDIHFIAEKEATQEEFFHTFNTLYDAHKQIVVSSDRSPREIPGLEERLISRFGWGLVTDIQPPDFETRVAILKKKMEKETVYVPDEVCFFIASQFKSNVRELEGALIRVVAYCALTNKPISLELTKEILHHSMQEEEKKISMEKVQRLVSEYFHIKVSDLRSKRRTKSVAEPRQIAMYLIRTLTTHSFPEIGEYFGGRDHTTVLHAYNKVSKDILTDTKKMRMLEEIKDMLKKSA
ncbi:MAG TPA: chromosomal replication initiator protein DnaA [Verrucomicrobiae bacterium]|nr:chromosomal replication initiator protein DnaA [Verrucomicrobiae bacterium]